MNLLDAPELAPYRDEPKQMPCGAPGKHGILDMTFARRGDRSVLAHLYREAPLLVQQALYWDEHLPGLPCVYIITTSGCVLQGDRQDVSITVGAGAMAHVTTQAATKVHQMDANFAAASQRLMLTDNAYLELLPGPVIPHRHSRFITHTQATVAETATLLNVEVLQPGRKHHGVGELFEFDLYSSALTASRPDGTPLFTEKLIAEPWRYPVRQAGVMGKFDVFANVTLITPRRHADQIFEQVVPGADASVDCVAGASRLPNDAGLVYKVLGMETEPVKAKVRAFWNLVRQQVLGAPIPAARPWGSPLLPTSSMALPVTIRWTTALLAVLFLPAQPTQPIQLARPASAAADEPATTEGRRVAGTQPHPPRRPGNPAGATGSLRLTDTEGITVMTGPITRRRDIESLKTAARWPGADRNTTVILAVRLAAARADAEGYRYFSELAGAEPGQALPLTLAGFFQARLGEDVDAALAMLDQAAAADLGPPQYFRGLALAGLPPERRRAEQAVADLEFVLAVRDQFPPVLLRAAYHGLAAAYAVLGHDEQAAEAERKSGLGAAPADTQLMFGGFSATAADGFRFTSPRIFRPEPGIQVAQGYDFGDLAFITTSDGVVAIDAGTTQDRVRAVLGDLDPPADGAISHLILTHAHWDHIGGAGALRGPGTRVIAQAGFPAGLDRGEGDRPRFRYFTGAAGDVPPAVVPDQLISEPTTLTVGSTEFVLYPTPGGETSDALMVHLPASGVLFTGDVMMPYLGQPFAGEGSPEGLLETLAFIGSLRPRLLIHGHPTLTEQFTAEAIPGLQAALTQLHGQVLDGIRGGRTLPDILADASLPAVLREHPTAVVPYLVVRDHFTERLYRQRTGYWQPDGRGLEPATAAEHAAALDLLAGGRAEQFAAAAATLIGQGDHALALQIIQPGLLRHPANSTLAALRATALHRLMEQYQQFDPFKFLIYAELAGAEIGPVE